MAQFQRRPQRRFRFPVLSRLTWAWNVSIASVIVVSGVFLLVSGREPPGRIALAIEGVEFLAPPPIRDAGPPPGTVEITRPLRGASGVRLTSTAGLRDNDTSEVLVIRAGQTSAELSGEQAIAADNTNFAGLADEPSNGEIIITIPGGEPRRATTTMAASLTAPPLDAAIPDPIAPLLEKTPFGMAPRIAKDGRRAADVYAKPFDAPKSAPRVALVVSGLGLNPALTKRAIEELPPTVSLSFAPYAKDLDEWTAKARAAGHEVLIELPMEGHGGNNAGLGAAGLLSSRTPEENLQRLDWLLARFGGYFAATNYMGSKLAADAEAMTPILNRLREAGVAYIDDTGVAGGASERSGVDWTAVNRMIPPAPNQGARKDIRRDLAALEKMAIRDGAAMGKTYAYDATIDEIAAWAQSLADKDVTSAPASAVLQIRQRAR